MAGSASRRTTLGMSPAEAAAHWLVRLDAGPLQPGEDAAFREWVAAAPAHAEAFANAERAWHAFDAAGEDANLQALRVSALSAAPERRRGWWIGLSTGIAASLLALAVFGQLLHRPAEAPPFAQTASAPARPSVAGPKAAPGSLDQSSYATRRGERRTLKLGDGSIVTLNTDSAIRVAYALDRRLIHLVRGQALFDVAKNKTRPFVVRAGDREVTALGTIFEVRLDPGRLKVTLVEGKVIVDGVDDFRKRTPAVIPAVLNPGQELVVQAGTRQEVSEVDVDKELRWRDGYVEFDDVPLSSAIEEINRYSTRALVVADARTGALRVSGLFRTGHPERFASIVGQLLPVHARTLPDSRIELVVGSPGPAAQDR